MVDAVARNTRVRLYEMATEVSEEIRRVYDKMLDTPRTPDDVLVPGRKPVVGSWAADGTTLFITSTEVPVPDEDSEFYMGNGFADRICVQYYSKGSPTSFRTQYMFWLRPEWLFDPEDAWYGEYVRELGEFDLGLAALDQSRGKNSK